MNIKWNDSAYLEKLKPQKIQSSIMAAFTFISISIYADFLEL